MNESDLILNKFRFNIGSFNFFSSLIKKNKNTKPMKKPKITYKLLNPISWLTKSDENNINIDIKNTMDNIMAVLPQLVYSIVGVLLIFVVIVVLVPCIQAYMGNFIFSAAGL